MRTLYRLSLLLWMLTFVLLIRVEMSTADPAASYQDGKAFGNVLNNKSATNPNNNNTALVPSYQGTNIPQTNLYGNPSQLSTDSQQKAATDPNAQYLRKSYGSRPLFVIDPKKDPTMKRSTTITNDPLAITGSLNSAFRECKQVPVGCTTNFTTQVCDEALRTEDKTCRKILNVTVVKTATCVHGTWLPIQQTAQGMAIQVFCDHTTPGQLRFRGATSIGYQGNFISDGQGWGQTVPSNYWTEFILPTAAVVPGKQIYDAPRNQLGGITRYGPAGSRWSLHKGINPTGLYLKSGGCDANRNCRYEFWHLMYRWGNGYSFCPSHPPGEGLHKFGSPPKCRNGQDPTPWIRDARFALVLNFKKPGIEYSSSEAWDNQCAALEATVGVTCDKVGSVCIDGPTTKNINGLDVSRPCWTFEDTYRCIAGPTNDNCKVLRDQGCDQLKSVCTASFPGSKICSVFQQTYRCPVQSCTGTQTVCGKQAYCLDGTCDDNSYQPNGDFGLVASAMSAVVAAGKDFNVNTDEIFKGKDLRCKKVVASIVDCCKATGWGIDIGLAQCDAEEQELGRAREAGRCHSVGRYCDQKFLTCVRTKDTFCCFSSKIGRIIHEQGRVQLGIGWGTPTAPNCQAFTVAQLQQIDFAKIDFSEFYQDVMAKTKIPNQSTTTNRVKDKINQYYQRGGPAP